MQADLEFSMQSALLSTNISSKVGQDNKGPSYTTLPTRWECTALLHPFSPPPNKQCQTTPFFQLCIATISYVEGQVLSVQVKGIDYGIWWYKITQQRTNLSIDQGMTWKAVNMGWKLPTTRWLDPSSSFFTTSHLNWMRAQMVDWWKMSVPKSRAATWMWFDHATGFPFRMMFGCPPPGPSMGCPTQLAFFQNFSFTYISSFKTTENPNLDVWRTPLIQGFRSKNLDGQHLPVWNECFAMTTIMTPVDSKSFPLPTTVLYQWKPDNLYRDTTDRAQATIMSFEHNPNADCQTETALLYGVAPVGFRSPPHAGSGYIYKETDFLVWGHLTQTISCRSIGLGQQPPYWARIPAVKGVIHATISDHKALCPGHNVNIISVVFPPVPQYPQGRYLWTWYSPLPGSDGTVSRPVWFGESASSIKEGGTCLALADYFDYEISQNWLSADFFKLPDTTLAKKLHIAKESSKTGGWLALDILRKASFKTQLLSFYLKIRDWFGKVFIRVDERNDMWDSLLE